MAAKSFEVNYKAKFYLAAGTGLNFTAASAKFNAPAVLSIS